MPATVRHATLGLGAIVLAAGLFASCRPASGPGVPQPPAIDPRQAAALAFESSARAIVARLSDEELVGQTLIIGVEGRKSLSNGSRSIVKTIKPGAVILFGFNVAEDPRSMALLTADLRAAGGLGSRELSANGNPAATGAPSGAATVEPFVAIDHEGGPVFRFKSGLTRLPSARTMGRAGLAAAGVAGTIAGSELRALGIGMNVAPVVEALTELNRDFLADRIWSATPEEAGTLSAAFIEACQKEGTAAVAKHFPGNARADPHRDLPVLQISRQELDEVYLPPFRAAIEAGVSAIMLSHVLVPALDRKVPVSVSGAAIGFLKKDLGFRGIVMTDDLQMAALAGLGGVGSAALAAMSAGADMLMVSGGRTALDVHAAMLRALGDGTLARKRLEDAAVRIIAQKLRYAGSVSDTAETDPGKVGPGSGSETRLAGLEELVARNRAALSRALGPGNQIQKSGN